MANTQVTKKQKVRQPLQRVKSGDKLFIASVRCRFFSIMAFLPRSSHHSVSCACLWMNASAQKYVEMKAWRQGRHGVLDLADRDDVIFTIAGLEEMVEDHRRNDGIIIKQIRLNREQMVKARLWQKHALRLCAFPQDWPPGRCNSCERTWKEEDGQWFDENCDQCTGQSIRCGLCHCAEGDIVQCYDCDRYMHNDRCYFSDKSNGVFRCCCCERWFCKGCRSPCKIEGQMWCAPCHLAY